LAIKQVNALPQKVLLKAAATLLAGITALNAIEALNLAPGSRVHINSPLGAFGRFAVQIATALGLDVVEVPKFSKPMAQ
jgi:D-arabinose 1-dehydrogenase-like Zn-dependent alcohol dehydrogenase